MLITVAQFKEHFRALTGAGEDPLITALIPRADALMAQFCGLPRNDAGVHTFTESTYSLFLDGPTTGQARRIRLGIAPVISITSVAVDSSWAYGSATDVADTLVDGEYLWLRPNASGAWLTYPRANRVILQGGFATTPPDLVATCAVAVRHLLDFGRIQGTAALTQGGQSVTRTDTDELLPASVRRALSPYVLWSSRAG